MKLHINLKQLTVFAAAFSATALLLGSAQSFAATKTWTGAGGDNKWSTAGNWNPSGAPTNGDDIVITSNGTTITSSMDISSLSVNSISMSGDKHVGIIVDDTTPLTIAGDVTSAVNEAGDSSDAVIGGYVILGADITATNMLFADNLNKDATLDLNGHALTFVDILDDSVTSIGQKITGNGSFNINIPNVSMFLNSANDYSGTTTIIKAGDTTTSGGVGTMGIFGTSDIVVSGDATISLRPDAGSSAFSNQITFEQASKNGNSYGNQLMIWLTGNTTLSIPNVILNGNTRFAVNNTGGHTYTINLAGIHANGYCIQYGSEYNHQAANWLNGPAACVVSGSNSGSVKGTSNPNGPGTPDTGFAILTSNPIMLASAAIAGSLGIALLARHRKLTSVR